MSDSVHALSEELVGYCGLCCADCFMYDGRIAALSKELRAELRRAKFAKFAEKLSEVSFFRELEHYEECYAALGVMVKLNCKVPCKSGGGNPFCKIRECCKKLGLDGCWQCSDIEKCDKHDRSGVHNDACHKNCKKITKKGLQEFLAGKRDW